MISDRGAAAQAPLVNDVASWLMARRAEFAKRAEQQRLPMTVLMPVPVADPSNGGYQIATENRQVSLFAAGEGVPPMLYAGITKPLIDGTGEAVAKELQSQFADGLKFVCHFGPGVLLHDMEHPELLSVATTSSPAATQDIELAMLSWQPIFYALILLRQCLLEYLREIPSLGRDDKALADRLATELVAFCAGSQMTHLVRVPIAGIELQGGAMEVGCCAIKPLTREESGYLYWRRMSDWSVSSVGRALPGAIHPETYLFERVILEVREVRPKTKLHSVAPLCQKHLLAWHMVGPAFAGSGFGAVREEPLWIQSSGQSFYPLLMPVQHIGSATVIDRQVLEEVTSLAQRIPDGAVTAPSSPQELAISRLGLGMSRQDPGGALVDYTVALEALLLSGADVGEARRRFALNGAVYAGRTHQERKRLYADLQEIYLARSVMVHGVSPAEPRAKRTLARIVEIRDRAREIARASVRRALVDGWPSEGEFVDALLDDARPNASATPDAIGTTA